jgi:hypothetical protein
LAGVPSVKVASGNIQLQPGDVYICTSTVNVTIDSNIEYNFSSYSAGTPMPLFEVVVKDANITIDTGVTQLAGLYVAEGTGSKGTISDYPAFDTPSSLPVGNEQPGNGDRLVVDGSFVANRILLYRSNGSVNDSSSTGYGDPNNSEEFDYSPINWLVSNGNITPTVDYITSLPPVY